MHPDPATAIVILSGAVLLLCLTVGLGVRAIIRTLNTGFGPRPGPMLLPQPPLTMFELDALELDGCGTGCCKAQPLPDATGEQLVPGTPLVSTAEVAASARRRAARDRTEPSSVTQSAEGH